MSWDSYIDSLIGYATDENGESHIDKACIIGKDGGKWTSDVHEKCMKIEQEEINAIIQAFDSKDFSSFQTNGVLVEGQSYRYLRHDVDTMLAKQKDFGALVVQCSKTAIVVAHMPEGKQQGTTNAAVAKIVEYLVSLDM